MQKSKLSDYKVDAQFAEGPYAIVVSSNKLDNKARLYSLKFFGYKKKPNDDWILREAEYLKSVRRLSGTVQIVSVFNGSAFHENPIRYPVIAMERLTGGSLQALLEQKTAQLESLTEGQVALIFRKLIIALHDVHLSANLMNSNQRPVRANLIHCNLKPLNVYFSTSDDTFPTKLVDFGFSVALHHRDEHYSYHATVAQDIGMEYLAPEQLEEHNRCQGIVFSRKTGS